MVEIWGPHHQSLKKHEILTSTNWGNVAPPSSSLILILNSYLVLLFIELVNDNTDKQIESEKAAKDDEGHKVQVHVDVDLPVRLVVHLHRVNGVVHDVNPTLPSGNLAI
jgi:hypothetical protein